MAKASIITRLGLDTTAFQTGLATSQKSIGSFVKNGISKFGAIVGVAGFGAMTNAAINMATEISNLSKLSGTGVEEFQKFAYAAKTVGVEQEKLGDILKDVSDKVGDFLQTGAGTLADFFEQIAPQIGVTAEEFRNLSGKDALQLYVSSLEKANLSQNEMTFYMEAIASDATLLLPLLRNNAQGLTELGEEAEKLGVIMDKETIASLNKASIEIGKFKVITTVLTGEIVSKVVPAFTMFFQGLGIVGDAFGTGIGKMMNFYGFLGRSVMTVIEPTILAFQSLAKGIEGVGQAAVLNKDDASASFAESKALATEAAEALMGIPEELAANAKRMNEEMAIDDASFTAGKIRRAKIVKDAMSNLMNETVEEEEKALDKRKANNNAFQTAKKMEIVRNANLQRELLDAEISGNAKKIAHAKQSLEFESSIQKIMKDTNVDRQEAINLAGKLYDATVKIEKEKIAYDQLSYQEQLKQDQTLEARYERQRERQKLQDEYDKQKSSKELMDEASKNTPDLKDLDASKAAVQGTIFLEEIRNELTRSTGATV